jgi:formate dehydrogenase iron-sulfur subunit
MLESIEGRRGMVRFKPPVPAIEGLFGKPTVINNVVSFATVPTIIERGGEFFRDYGVGNSRGTIPFQLAGNVKRPGLIEMSMGVTLRELVQDYGGGTASGKPVRAVQVGGPLGAFFSSSNLDVPLDFESVAARGGILGHGGIVIFDDTVDMARMARYAMEFCAIESCGKCTPCRIGSTRGTEVIEDIVNRRRPRENLEVLRDLCDTMKYGSLCALGGLTPLPVLSALKYFPEDFGLAASDVDFIGADLTIATPGATNTYAIAQR